MILKNISFNECLEKVKTPPKLEKSKYLKDGNFPVVSQEASLISGYCNDSKMLFKIKKPIVVFGDHTRILKYIDFDFITGADGVKILQPIDDVDPKYFYYLLKLYMPESTGYARHYKLLKELNFSIPYFTEQQRIVAKLDTAFAEIDNSERILKDRLKKLSTLFNSYIEEKLRDLKKNFPVVELKEVIKSVQYGTSKKCSKEGEFPVLRMGNMQGGKFDLDELVYLDDQREANKYQISKFDVFFNRTNSALHVGKAAIWEGQEKALFAGYLIRVNYDKSKVDPYFLNFFLNVKSTREYGYSVMTESINQANINGTKLKQYPFVRADLETQKKLSSKFCDLEKRLVEAINLTKQSLELYGKLTKSVLSSELKQEES